MKRDLDSAQELTLQLIRFSGSWNAFKGDAIAADLDANRRLWKAAYLTSLSSSIVKSGESPGLETKVNLLPLRQLAQGYCSPDTLFILPAADTHTDLEKLASTWETDEISWLSHDYVERAMYVGKKGFPELFPDKDRAVLYLWWD